MTKLLSSTYKVAKADIHTGADDHFEHLLNIEADKDKVLFDKHEIEGYSIEELHVIEKCIKSKGIVKAGERYLKHRWLGQKGDDWKGVMVCEYPESVYEICMEHDLFEQ